MIIKSSDEINSVLKTYFFIEKKISWFKNIKILEVGSGKTGEGLLGLADRYNGKIQCFGVDDVVPENSNRISLFRQNPDSIPFADNYFEIVYSCNYLFYFEDEKMLGILKEVLRVLKSNGYFVFNDYRRNNEKYEEMISRTGIRAKITDGSPKLIIKY